MYLVAPELGIRLQIGLKTILTGLAAVADLRTLLEQGAITKRARLAMASVWTSGEARTGMCYGD